MKAFKIALVLIVFAVTACKKDDDKPKQLSYQDIKLSDVIKVQARMNDSEITASDDTGILWKAGDVFLYKNRLGGFGKLQVISIDKNNNYELGLRITVYHPDGSIAENVDPLFIRGTWGGDLVALTEALVEESQDFHWSRNTQTVTKLSPANGALFVKYN